jgi:hypothetical protein
MRRGMTALLAAAGLVCPGDDRRSTGPSQRESTSLHGGSGQPLVDALREPKV